MTPVEGTERSGRGQRLRVAGQRLFGDVADHYRTMKRRLAEMLMRGDRDCATLSAISQEIGRMRQKIRADLQRRRDERDWKRQQRKALRSALPED
ncbi:hypothetical protein [Tianweitania sediminis]|uniref:Uncharacterized protein n=1 Tax=Tianweitania sediminis TaxID=1502156 RepID=A0A8J7RMN6_9HYPH|nr:hypothetical protein [Tianweitania sediminis]MBP0441176.1 hypothetical protein [Tianweitania sediminis]